jgi:hypothetical protein
MNHLIINLEYFKLSQILRGHAERLESVYQSNQYWKWYKAAIRAGL